MSDTSFDYSLDERQRTMLEAMGIKLWLPDHEAAPSLAPTPTADPQAAVETVQKPVTAENLEPKQPLAGIESAQRAIKNIVFAEQILEPTPTALALSPRPAGIEQMDWPALQSAVSGCQACGLCQSRKNTVFGVGQAPADSAHAPQVDWLIVGEAPGENEDAQGEPFVGQAGKLLDNMLAAMRVGENGKGLSRSQGVYIANVLKCRPPANRNPSPEEVAMCEPYLARQIELLRPKIILAMGKFAISTLTGSNDPVGKLRGRVHTLKHASLQLPVIVTYHPAYLLRNLPDKAKAWADLLLAMQTYRELSNPNEQASLHTDR
ncbi:uracil-DNA glycosylase [Variovorax sp. PCZ-1]|uniref:uracil-DNA glycosylase n=1 Tax=Variovorax sp. PCZ-1 TaxID=2835533 RepID=UPI001BCC932F|nr:uracil-DNA glycosylase [Variovorax sp. PCZ-1]MBS7806081.1 uracil-DNA glycosylase [Variovorax sp. PCZ-1]